MTSACPACVAAPIALTAAGPAVAANIWLSLPTIHCAACIGKVERALLDLPGVTHARVNLSLKRVAISATALAPETAIATLHSVGYEAHLLDRDALTDVGDQAGRNLLMRLAVAGFAMMNVMLLSVAIWSGAADATRDLFHLISAAISLPAVIFAGQPFFHSAWRAIRVQTLNMDVPISLAILLAAGMSLFETLNGGEHAYFDAALSLTFFLLIGRYLDHTIRRTARSAAKELSALESHVAQKMIGGKAVKVALADLKPGDTILIPTGMRVPVDGTLAGPASKTDRSFLTGESAPVIGARGDPVQAGEINLGAAFQMDVTAVGEDTTLRRIAGLVEMAESSRGRYVTLADRAARIYAPAVHLLALGAFTAWMVASGDVRLSLNVAIAVLIITCPCALGLAVPAVATAAIGRLYRQGYLVKSSTALERLAEVDTIVFDKTGTLTVPNVDIALTTLSDIEKSMALALAQASDHPVSRAVAAALADRTPAKVSAIAEVTGCGVEATFEGQNVRLGRGDWIGAQFTGVGLRIGRNKPRAILRTEAPRPGAAAAIRQFQESGFRVLLISGDVEAAVRDIAETLNVAEFHAGVSAEQKHRSLRNLEKDGHRVLMVGDGLNDTAALAAAHASVAPSSALDAARNAADIVFLKEDMSSLPAVIRTAKFATRLSKQNFGIAAAYNLIAIPIALAGLATPLVAALAMSASSITVLLNAMRVRIMP
ncbi:MAG: cadmium-translocating P-type ATPase [Rhodobacter sp.]|nr:cadmium-translocating P-type ATPase [Rhodobacter sp.]